MSTQSNTATIATVLVGVIVIVGFVGYGYYATSSTLASLTKQNEGLSEQLSGLDQANSNLNQQISSQNQQISGQSQQISSLNQQVSSLSQVISSLEQRTLATVTQTDTIVTVETTTSVTTTTQTSVTAVPESTLIVTSDSYDNNTHTFTFKVQNTEDYTVYAQLSASLWGSTSYECNGQAGTFISQVYTFAPDAVVTTQMDLALGSYSGFCGGQPLSSVQMDFVIPQSTPVSPTYTFIVVPNYTFP